MVVRVRRTSGKQLSGHLSVFEAKYGLGSTEFADKFDAGELQETDDFRHWSLLYEAWKLAATPETVDSRA